LGVALGRGNMVDRTHHPISADSHVNEPPDLCRERVANRFRDRAPRIESFEHGDAHRRSLLSCASA
jgi:hypothetical protein